MSQKKETIILFVALIITLGLVGGGVWLFTKNSKPPGKGETTLENSSDKKTNLKAHISSGEKILITSKLSPEKQAGVEAIASGKYDRAIANLEASLKANRNDPEALIYLNNARIGKQKNYSIAVSVPIGTDPNGSQEILRGVAQAQNEINESGGIKRVKLKVAIANDDNNPEVAKQIATELVKNSEILGVVGPFASDVSLAAGTVYKSGQLVAISPVSTSVKLSGFSKYFLRTVPSDYVAARALADYMLTKLKQKNAAIFFNSQSSYSQSLKSEFATGISLGGGQITNEFDLSSSDFSAAKSVEQAIRQGTQVLMLAADTSTLDKALQVVQVNRKRLTLLGGDDIYTFKTLEIGAEQAAGMVLAVPWHINADSKSNFPRQSRELWGADVNWRTALSYDATKALIAAMTRNPTRSGIQQTLSSPDFSTAGASGNIRFLPSGDRNATIQLVEIVPGKRSGTDYDFAPVQQKP